MSNETMTDARALELLREAVNEGRYERDRVNPSEAYAWEAECNEAIDHISARRRGAVAPESDEQYADAEALIAHLDALMDDGGQGGEKWQPAQAAIAGILSWQTTGSPVAAPAPVAGDAVAELARHWTEDDCGMCSGIYRDAGAKLTAALAQDRASQAGAAVPSLIWLEDNHTAWIKDDSDTPYLVWLRNALIEYATSQDADD